MKPLIPNSLYWLKIAQFIHLFSRKGGSPYVSTAIHNEGNTASGGGVGGVGGEGGGGVSQQSKRGQWWQLHVTRPGLWTRKDAQAHGGGWMGKNSSWHRFHLLFTCPSPLALICHLAAIRWHSFWGLCATIALIRGQSAQLFIHYILIHSRNL